MIQSLVPLLSAEEKRRLGELELIVERNIQGFIQAGRALLEIREKRLWRAQYRDFAEYCQLRYSIARTTADQFCRSTQLFETLAASTGAPDSDTPVPENIPEVVLRPLTTLPGPELQGETWRLAAKLSPDGKPTRTVAAKVCRLVRTALDPNARQPKDRETMFVRPIQRLAKVSTFNPSLATMHVTNAAQATRIIYACQVIRDRCLAITTELEKRFA
jgi:hypothetical protein